MIQQARVGLVAQRDVVLDAVVAVIIQSADAFALDAASDLLGEPALSAARSMALVAPRRAQVVAAFSSSVFHNAASDGDSDGDDVSDDDDDDDLSVAGLLTMRQGLMATRAAIEADLSHRRLVLAETQPSSPALIDTVDTQRWGPQDLATIEDAAGVFFADDDAVLALQGALRAVAAELADNARLLRRRQEAEAGLEHLDAVVIADARALTRRVLIDWLSSPAGAHRFVEDIFPVVLAADGSALGVLRATRALSQGIRLLDALEDIFVKPFVRLPVAKVDNVDNVDDVERGLQRVSLWARALATHLEWSGLREDEDIWATLLAHVAEAFVSPDEEAQRGGDFVGVLADERVRAATKIIHQGALPTSPLSAPPMSSSPSSSPSSSSRRSTALPHRLDRYTLVERLGGGGMGEVFLAQQDGPRGFSKRVVIKCIHTRHADDAHFISLFQREARVVARLSHDNVIAVFDVGVSGGRWFMAVEHLNGQSGEKLVPVLRDHPDRVSYVARIIADAAAGLAHAHDRGVIHSDVSPDNLFVTTAGRTKLIDFGVASIVTESHQSDNLLMGKLPYMAPELFERAAATVESDLWALGVTAYQLLTGSRPFDGGNQVHTVRRITSENVDLSALRQDVFSTLVDELLAKDPTQRPRPAEVAERLDALCCTPLALAALLADIQPTGPGRR